MVFLKTDLIFDQLSFDYTRIKLEDRTVVEENGVALGEGRDN